MSNLHNKQTLYLWFSLILIPHTLFACEEDSYRQFDFWVGKWQVTQADGKIAGTNHITKSLNNCVIHEHYQSVNGYEGTSINIYDKNSQQWHQTWVDNTGLLLQLNGGLVGKDMVMWGEGMDQSGRIVMHRIAWTPTILDSNQEITVQQKWQVSHDQGISWQLLFDGTYKKAPSPKK